MNFGTTPFRVITRHKRGVLWFQDYLVENKREILIVSAIIIQLVLEPRRKLELFGPTDNNLKLIRDRLDVQITARQSDVIVSGKKENVNKAARVIDKMQKHLIKHGNVTTEKLENLLAENESHQESAATSDKNKSLGTSEPLAVYSHKKVIEPATTAQLEYIETMLANDITFCIGPAGTGKTYLAVAVAAAMLKKKRIRRIVLARPAVEAGEKLGFLPGDIQAKVNPYLRPLFDSLMDMMDFAQMKKFMELDIIEIIPLAFMRGRTLNDSIVICDEAQNTSGRQMLMVLTRLGRGSKMIVTGDITQTDLAADQKSGMIEAIQTLDGIKGIGNVALTQADIIRHRLVQDVVNAYKKKNDLTEQPKNIIPDNQ